MNSSRKLARLLGVLLGGALFSLCSPAQAPQKADRIRAEKALIRGDRALEKGQVEEALAAYDEALRNAPGDLAIAERVAATRSELVRNRVDTAEQQALEGNLRRAIEELRAALKLDPGNTIVTERLKEMQSIKDSEEAPRRQQEETALTGVPKVRPQAGKRSFNIQGDTRSAYEEVARAFGISVAFDPDITSRRVRLRVDGVDFTAAMQLLGDATGTFWRPLNATLAFVAPDNAEKRREYAIHAEQTFPLPEAVTPADQTEILRVLREITGATHIELDTKSQSITVRDTPERIQLAGELIRQMERARGELMLEIELLEVDGNAARKLGIVPPSSAQAISLSTSDVKQLERATTLQNLLTILQAVFAARGITVNPAQVVPVGGGKSTYLLNLPSAAANFSQALSLVRSGREILLRAQDGKPATFFVGQRFPVTLSFLSASLGGTVLGGTVKGIIFPRTDFDVGQVPRAIVAQDFNNDGQKDLATANQGDSSISILINEGNGNFKQAAGSPIVLGTNEQGPEAIASGVFRLTDAQHLTQPADLVVANTASNTVSVLLGNGDGTFVEAPGSPFAVGARPRAVVLADFNGDGNLDFAAANSGDNTISVFRGNGDGTFTPFAKSPFQLPTTEQGPVAMARGNFRSSATPGLAVVNQTTRNVAILEASGNSTFDGTFTEETGSPIGVGQLPVAIASGDLNADGFPDLAVVNQGDNSVTVLLNKGDATFTQATGSPLPTPATPAGVAIADFTADGLGDIAVTNNGVSTLGVYAGLGSGLFSPRLELSTPSGPDAITTTDLNGDGLPDVALTAHSGSVNQVSVLLDSSSFASSSVRQFPFPGSEYIDLGVKVKATPTLNNEDEVTLQLEFEIRSLAGSSVNGIPVLTNRTLTQTVRLKANETSLLGGLLDREETRAIAGLPGFANLPLGAGHAFGSRNNLRQDTELLILLTPRQLRLPERNARAILAGREGKLSGPGTPVFRPREEFPPEQPTPQPPTEAPPPEPQPPQPPQM